MLWANMWSLILLILLVCVLEIWNRVPDLCTFYKLVLSKLWKMGFFFLLMWQEKQICPLSPWKYKHQPESNYSLLLRIKTPSCANTYSLSTWADHSPSDKGFFWASCLLTFSAKSLYQSKQLLLLFCNKRLLPLWRKHRKLCGCLSRQGFKNTCGLCGFIGSNVGFSTLWFKFPSAGVCRICFSEMLLMSQMKPLSLVEAGRN